MGVFASKPRAVPAVSRNKVSRFRGIAHVMVRYTGFVQGERDFFVHVAG